MIRPAMRYLSIVGIGLSVSLALLSACGSSDNSGPGGGGGNANFTATVDGASWTSAAFVTQATGNPGGAFALVGGTGTAGGTTLSIVLFNVDAPGTYPLGVSGTQRGGIATITVGASTQSTPLSGVAGTVTVTAISATHITGTFAFDAGAAPHVVSVTQGSFDLPVTTSGGSIAVAPYAGNSFAGTLNAAPWVAATVVMVSPPSSATVAVGVGNDAYQFNAIVSGWTGVGTYALGSGVSRQVSGIKMGTTQSWGGTGGASSGSITVTAQTATRMQGSYDVTLAPAGGGASGNLHLVGNFDFGIAP
jgi:hypothetical protein